MKQVIMILMFVLPAASATLIDAAEPKPSDILAVWLPGQEGLDAFDDRPDAAELAVLLASMASGDGDRVMLAASAYANAHASANIGGIEASADATVDSSTGTASAAATFVHAPIVSIRLECSNDVYTSDFQYLVDACGNDTYHNNAGGNGGAGCTMQFVQAALVDLAGSDVYGNASAPRDCGANGGGLLGAGLLVDVSGDDAYHAGSHGTNGGGSGPAGIGVLIDGAGNDTYVAGEFGVNGGGMRFGSGSLTDLGVGNDGYTAYGVGANGGAFAASGSLVDHGGVDTYQTVYPGVGGSVGTGVNGGLQGSGHAVLLDLGGLGDAYIEDLHGAGDPLDSATDETELSKGGGRQIDA